VVIVGWFISPVTAVLCDGPPKSQSFILFSGGCDRLPPSLPCTPGFMFPAQPSPGGDFPAQYYLDFGDGSLPYYGPVDGITHTYHVSGLFTLKFMAGTQCDLWRQDTYVMNISAPENFTPVIPACAPIQPASGFTGVPTSGVAPLTVQFTSTSSNANAYAWIFGDGGTSPAQNPRHTYIRPGTYGVSLEARDTCSGSVSNLGMDNLITVSAPLATLSVTSNPPGAAVFVDNVMRGVTPITLTDTVIGNHVITIRMEGYEEYTKNVVVESSSPVTIVAGLRKSVPEPTPQLPSAFGSIAITSIPSGAAVSLDGSQRGTTPAIFHDIVPGSHEVTLSQKGYDDWTQAVSVGSGQTAAINANLVFTKEPAYLTGLLAVTTDPPGAEVYIDGVFKGVSPITIPGLSDGEHTIVLTMQDYANTTSNLTITAGQTQKFATGLHKVFKPSVIDLLLAAGAIVMIVVIALVVMFRKESK
ncbi:MAG TPA: PEGA domain-containing protein, partial [Methanoregula sp.]|nr:PEGA domain-containing protein [Methanoregula sp.]